MNKKFSKTNIFILLIFILIVIISVHFFFIFYNNLEPFENNKDEEKTLCLIWSDNDKKQSGLGDCIRGLICLHQFCKKQKYSLILDCRESSLSLFMKNLTTPLLLEPRIQPISYQDDSEIIYIYNDRNVQPFETNILIDKFKTTNFIKLWVNIDHDYEVTPETVNLMNFIFEPTEPIKQEVNKIKKTLPQNYGIQHARFNDDVLQNDITLNDAKFIKTFELIKNKIQPTTDVLISNSMNFKKFVKQQLNMSTITSEDNTEREVAHVANSNSTESYKNTMVEFLILKDAKYINSFTFYSWCSNFTSHISKIYDIPYHCQTEII
jgi:hypothetical protein